MNEILTIEEINAAPSLDWDALIEWRDKIDAKLEEISEAVGEGETVRRNLQADWARAVSVSVR